MSSAGSENREVALVREQASEAATQAEKVIIKDDLGLTNATDILSRIKSIAKAAKARKEEITKPLNEALSSARSLFKPIETSCEQAESVIKGKIIAYQDEQEAKAEKARVKLADKVASGYMKPETAVARMEEVADPSTSHQGNEGAISQRTIRKVRFIDPPQMLEFFAPEVFAGMIKNGYFVWNETKARTDALAGMTIPGAEVYEEKIISAR